MLITFADAFEDTKLARITPSGAGTDSTVTGEETESCTFAAVGRRGREVRRRAFDGIEGWKVAVDRRRKEHDMGICLSPPDYEDNNTACPVYRFPMIPPGPYSCKVLMSDRTRLGVEFTFA